jgi:Predicted integral membrane protein
MYKKILLSAIAAFMLIVSQIAVAQAAGPGSGHGPGPDYHSKPAVKPPQHRPPAYKQHPRKTHAQPHRPPAYKRPQPPPGYDRYKFSNSWRSSHGNFRPGYAMPKHYRHNHQRYIVHDWHTHGLYAPPHGHHWMMVDGNFVLAAVTTGIIAHILLGH